MFWFGIIFLLLVSVLGLRAFTVMRVILRVCIIGVIALLVFAALQPAKQNSTPVQPTATPIVKWGFMKQDALVEPSPTPKVLIAQEEPQLFDYGFDDGSSTQPQKTKRHRHSQL
jgi:hypothetical protein